MKPVLNEEQRQKFIDARKLQPDEYRVLPDGTFACIIPLVYYSQLCLGCGENDYLYAFYFQRKVDAVEQLAKLTECTDVPLGGWTGAWPQNRLPQPPRWEFEDEQMTIDEVLLLRRFDRDKLKDYVGKDKGADAFLQKMSAIAHPEVMCHLTARLLEAEKLYAVIPLIGNEASKKQIRFLAEYADRQYIDITERIAVVLSKPYYGYYMQFDDDGQDLMFAPLYKLLLPRYGTKKASELAAKCRYF